VPNDVLIAQLDSLRETYNGRLRATNGLLAALKATTDAFGKTGRSLREYAEAGASVTDMDKLANAREAFETQRIKDDAVDPLRPELRREVKSLGATTTALRDAAASLRGEIVDVVKLDGALPALQAARGQDEALAALLPVLNDELLKGQAALGATFGVALRHAMREKGIEPGGKPPRFALGRFDVAADFAKRTASVSYGKEVALKRVPLGVDAIVAAYERAYKSVEGRTENPERWVELFRDAWNLARLRRGASGSDRANIVDCYFELTLLRQSKNFRIEPTKGGFAEYGRAQFAHDFRQFSGRRHAYKGEYFSAHESSKGETDRADKSIWILSGDNPYEGHYMSDITYDKA
jgi:hypothetical protein